MKVKCPNCKKQSLFSSKNKFRPFCSERCKLIDLGEWASESFKIADEELADEEDILKEQLSEELKKQ